MNFELENKSNVVIKFAGDSGDGMQLTGAQFAENVAIYGNDIVTFPDFPAEIRAPIGTIPGVSGYQLQFSEKHIFSAGDEYDVLVALNSAAYKTNIKSLKKGGILIINTNGFDDKNLRLSNYDINPLEVDDLSQFKVYQFEITKNTKEALSNFNLSNKEVERCKNLYVLGIINWLFNRNLNHTIEFISKKFKSKQELIEANIKALKSGFHFAETCELFQSRYEVKPFDADHGEYRSINGNQALSLGLITASMLTDLPLFLGSYPITPASDILHELSKYSELDIVTFQAEDEIAAICSAIGASYGGCIGVTTSSGPGIALKTEGIGLATMTELPLIICNIQRGGPSTGLPTKTEQADLMQALYGRNGECPIVVIAAKQPSDCFTMAYMAVKIAMEFTVPVMLLSDGYLANGAEPWKIPNIQDLEKINLPFINQLDRSYYPYERNENLSRKLAVPGSIGLENRIGGLEKENVSGNISYDPANHELMVKLRARKVENVADILPKLDYEIGNAKDKILIVSWGGTFGSVYSAVKELREEHYQIAQIHLNYINPFQKELKEILDNFEKIIVPELNDKQLSVILSSKYNKKITSVNKIQGQPFKINELKQMIIQNL